MGCGWRCLDIFPAFSGRLFRPFPAVFRDGVFCPVVDVTNLQGREVARAPLSMSSSSDSPPTQTPQSERLEPAPSTFEQCIRQAQVLVE